MQYSYPIQFDAKATAEEHTTPIATKSFSGSNLLKASFFFNVVAKANQETKRIKLASISGWPETKTEMATRCVDLGWPLGRACTDVPVIYHRSCEKSVYVDITYPNGVWDDVNECVVGAAVAATVAAVISSGGAAVGTFEAALKGCLVAKGAAWANEVRVSGGTDSECGDWHPI